MIRHGFSDIMGFNASGYMFTLRLPTADLLATTLRIQYLSIHHFRSVPPPMTVTCQLLGITASPAAAVVIGLYF
jgi:hypothetical protein